MIDPLDDSPSTPIVSDSAPVNRTVVQWLNEVKALQQHVADLNAELSAATDTANAWRSRYEIEGQQRRAEVTSAQHTIAKLEAEIKTLLSTPELDANIGDSAIALQIEGMLNMNELKAKLFEVWLDRDRALAAIKSEQIAHEQTRRDLTMALADAMDVLKPD